MKNNEVLISLLEEIKKLKKEDQNIVLGMCLGIEAMRKAKDEH